MCPPAPPAERIATIGMEITTDNSKFSKMGILKNYITNLSSGNLGVCDKSNLANSRLFSECLSSVTLQRISMATKLGYIYCTRIEEKKTKTCVSPEKILLQ